MATAPKKATGGAAKAAVQVFCRIRPTNPKELASGAYTCVKYGEQNIEVKTEEGENKFNFDQIFGMDSTQLQVFNHIAGSLILDVLSGYNATILAYGQSGTGKV
jgi:DNA-binding NtrC family response regulator